MQEQIKYAKLPLEYTDKIVDIASNKRYCTKEKSLNVFSKIITEKLNKSSRLLSKYRNFENNFLECHTILNNNDRILIGIIEYNSDKTNINYIELEDYDYDLADKWRRKFTVGKYCSKK